MEDALSEVETLRCIFEDGIEIDDCSSDGKSAIHVRRKVRPNDEGDVSSASVKVEIVMECGYPDEIPTVILREPRGLGDGAVSEMKKIIDERMEEIRGMPMVFEILQIIASYIEENQHSDSLQCPICLCPLAGQPVSCTPCDHYTHTECLRVHIAHSQKQLGETLEATPQHMRLQVNRALYCPVCRSVVDEELEPIYPVKESTRRGKSRRSKGTQNTPEQMPKSNEPFDFNWKSWRETQSKLRTLFEKQKANGGIIDLEEERKKNLITEETVVMVPSIEEPSAVPSISETSVSAERIQAAPTSTIRLDRHNFRGDPIRSNWSRRENGYQRGGKKPRPAALALKVNGDNMQTPDEGLAKQLESLKIKITGRQENGNKDGNGNDALRSTNQNQNEFPKPPNFRHRHRPKPKIDDQRPNSLVRSSGQCGNSQNRDTRNTDHREKGTELPRDRPDRKDHTTPGDSTQRSVRSAHRGAGGRGRGFGGRGSGRGRGACPSVNSEVTV